MTFIDTSTISRIQFAFTICFHIIFPVTSISLATFLFIMEGAYLATKKKIYYNICRYWGKIFALAFGMGVVSGVAMEVQLGTNWAIFSKEVGSVLGGLFTYEVMTAFFIEAGFLGVMIFAWEKVSPKVHFMATTLVFIGVTVSAFWILAANSWMQTPAGAILEHGRFVVQNWHTVIFNHSTLVRFTHMLLAAYITGAFFIAAVCAYYLLKKEHMEFAKKCFSFAFLAITILTPIQLYMGDTVGREVYQNQPLKTAAIEGIWNTQNGAPLLLFAYPDKALQKNLFPIGIPHLASVMNTHQWNGKLIGLKSVAPRDQPVVAVVFYAFRIMVGLGLLMFLFVLVSLWLRWRKQFYDSRWFLIATKYFAPFSYLAIITGWITAECGRQPWVVYNLLRTKDAVSPVSAGSVLTTFILIFVIYFIIFGVFFLRYLAKLIRQGPTDTSLSEQPFGYMSTREKGE